MNLMEKAIKQTWIISECPEQWMDINEALREASYIIFCPDEQDDSNIIERLLSMEGINFLHIALFTKLVGRHATITEAFFVLNPFDNYSQQYWDAVIDEENNGSYVYAREGVHFVRDLYADSEGSKEDIIIDKPRFFS